MSNIHFELFKFMNEHGDKTQDVRKSVMPDREKVIKALECCLKESDHLYSNPCNSSPYEGKECIDRMKTDALALLKEQEAKPMIENERGWNCPSCGMNLIGKSASGYPCALIDLPEDEPIHFCPMCGQAVKWE